MMTPRERVRAAMHLEVPDRVPVMCQLSIGHMLVRLNASPVELWHDPDTFIDALLSLRAMYDFDGILVSLHGHDPEWRKAIRSRRNTDEGEIVEFTDGRKMIYPSDDLPRPFPAEDLQAKDNFSPGDGPLPEYLDYIPVSQGLRFAIHPAHRFDIFRSLRARAGNDFSIHGEVTSPFDYFLDLFGHEQGMMHLIDDPGNSKRFLKRFAGLVADVASEMCGTDIDAIKISSPFAGAGFLSREFYREFVLPFEAEVIRSVRKHGIAAYVHTCGSIGDRLDLMMESGANGIECLDPPPLGNVELQEAKNLLGAKGFIKGNVDSVNTLLLQDRSEVLEDLRKRVQVGKAGGGFILSTACSVAPHVTAETMRLFREAVEQWG